MSTIKQDTSARFKIRSRCSDNNFSTANSNALCDPAFACRVCVCERGYVCGKDRERESERESALEERAQAIMSNVYEYRCRCVYFDVYICTYACVCICVCILYHTNTHLNKFSFEKKMNYLHL